MASELVGCGARSGLEASGGARGSAFPWESSIAPVRVRRPADCVQDWRTLHESTNSAPPSIVIAAGELIYGELVGGDAITYQIRALDLAQPSRSPRVIRDGLDYEELWLEGDRLLVQSGGRLIAVPLGGGGEDVVLDARGPDDSMPVLGMLVEQDAFYWARPGTNPAQIELWQQERGGGGPRRIAALDDGRFDVQLMAATSESVIIADRFSGVTVPIDGGPLQPLDSVEDGELAGIDGLGIYYVRASNRTLRGGRALEFEIRRAPADGAPTTRFWHRRAGHHLSRIWPADSGWLATGDYYMFDRRPHGVIAHIDENGSELLIACDRGDNFPISRPVYYEGAFYVVTRAEDNRWRIVEIRLPE